MIKSALITVVTIQDGADFAKLCSHEGGEVTRVTHRTSLSDSDRADPLPPCRLNCTGAAATKTR